MIIKEQDTFIMIPKAIFKLPSEKKAQALKELEADMKKISNTRRFHEYNKFDWSIDEKGGALSNT
ncbi:hypothetical protein SAMN02910293_01135 [Streptococcus henryi]|uniref:Uncharacterized protein n=1 Tax=Streptococcus henryi TaxID=439219 RepID=A0A1G6BP81_9STRE|nr:hypothetical protein SAMN02910293_01135 [Streptococcus henryi]